MMRNLKAMVAPLLRIFLAISVLLLTLSASAICVSSRKANLRAGPSTKSKVTWVVGKYMPLKMIGRQGDWLQVKDVDGEEHWIYAGMVTRSFRCSVVRTRSTNLRTGPSRKHPQAEFAKADKYTPFKLLQKRQGWTQVQSLDGKKYWVYEKNLWEPVITLRVDF